MKDSCYCCSNHAYCSVTTVCILVCDTVEEAKETVELLKGEYL